MGKASLRPAFEQDTVTRYLRTAAYDRERLGGGRGHARFQSAVKSHLLSSYDVSTKSCVRQTVRDD